ncbi:hypothetical protein D3C76_904170 [compost metagenome]
MRFEVLPSTQGKAQAQAVEAPRVEPPAPMLEQAGHAFVQLVAGVLQADPRSIDPAPAIVQAPVNPFLKQYPSATQVAVLRYEGQVIVIDPAVFENAQAITDAAPIELQRHHAHATLLGQGNKGIAYPLVTPRIGENADAFFPFPADSLDFAQGVQQWPHASGIRNEPSHLCPTGSNPLARTAHFVAGRARNLLAVGLGEQMHWNPAVDAVFRGGTATRPMA